MPKRILVTGAAGLLGGETVGLLRELGHEVIGLVNRNSDIRRNDGALVDGVRTIKGDLTQDRLGLPEADWRALAAEVDAIVHGAAITEFTDETPLHRAVNVDGTARIVDMALAANAELVHISTAYVCGTRDGIVLERELAEGQGFTNGYEATKFEAELIVRESGARYAIVRPSIVLGNHADGRTRSFDTIYPILKVFAEGLVTTMPASPSSTLDLVPIDYVCRGIAEVADRFEAAEGQVFHLKASSPTPLEAFPETLSSFRGLSFPKWVDPASFDPSTLSPVERRFFKRGAEVYARYFSRNPQFDDANWRAFSDLRCPPTDEAWWRRLVGYAVEAGFIRVREKARA